MRLYSGVPDLAKTRISGPGLTTAIVGKGATVIVQCFDVSGARAPGGEHATGVRLQSGLQRSWLPDLASFTARNA